jgi:hypothetical protein
MRRGTWPGDSVPPAFRSWRAPSPRRCIRHQNEPASYRVLPKARAVMMDRVDHLELNAVADARLRDGYFVPRRKLPPSRRWKPQNAGRYRPIGSPLRSVPSRSAPMLSAITPGLSR